MTPGMIAMAGLVGFGLLIVFWQLAAPAHRRPGELSALALAIDPSAVRDLRSTELDTDFFERIIRPGLNRVGEMLVWLMPQARVQRIERKLIAADGMWGLTPISLLGVQMLTAVLGAVVGLALAFFVGDFLQGILVVVILGVIGYLYADLLLDQRVKKRRRTILKELPNALDLIVVGVEAGLGLDAAIKQVSGNVHTPLAHEFGVVLNQMRLGRSRREALLDMENRIGLPDINVLVDAILQADKFGTALGTTLRIQAEEVRRKRRQRAEEMGAKAPLKMLFPMVGCIFPTLFIILLGPAAITVIHQVI